ncbi:MAG: phosphonate ABC transporter substrate-binding protein [Loktanella sp.]|nr:phosphonate ABC transporter substrate-binding protein [Loktanella sp.]
MRLTMMTALATLMALPAVAEDWKTDYRIVRFALISSENELDRNTRWGPFEDYLEETLGVEVEIFPAGSYDSAIQALAAGQIEFSWFGPSAYAAAWSEMDGNVVPLLTTEQQDGSFGYHSVIAARCDAGYTTVDDLAGKTLAFADPNSASGYTVPFYTLSAEGYPPEEFFGAVPFSGSHESSIMGVVNGQFDAAATSWSNEISGNVQRMVSKGMIAADDICFIWKSPLIPSSPFTARANLPQGLIDDMKAAVMATPTAAPELFKQITGGEASTAGRYIDVEHEQYEILIEMRDWFRANRRG